LEDIEAFTPINLATTPGHFQQVLMQPRQSQVFSCARVAAERAIGALAEPEAGGFCVGIDDRDLALGSRTFTTLAEAVG
jgi:hypothetical protein